MFSSHDALEPADLAFLHRLLIDVCRLRGYSAQSEQARPVARDLINWYLFGIREPQDLKAMLDPIEIAGTSA